MTFNVDNFGTAVNKMIQQIAESTPDITQIIAKDAILLIKNRIQEKGLDADGSRLKGYSTTEVPAFFFYNKATNEAGRNIVKQRQKEKRGLSYKDFKAANNGQESIQVTNLTFTGDQFRQLDIISTGNNGGNYIVTIGGKTTSASDKIDFNSERYGDILRVSQEEEEQFQQTMDDEIQKIIDQNGFGK